MRTVYIDSSALVKIYALEPGSRRMEALFKSATAAEPTATMVVCDLSLTEVASAVARKLAERDISPSQAARYMERLNQDFLDDPRPYLIIPASTVIRDAQSHIHGYGLKSADAIHLAAALAARYNAPPDTRFQFACTDGKLYEAASAEGFDMMRLPSAARAGGG